MLKRYFVLIGAVFFASQLACDTTEIVLPESGGETQLFNLPDTWETVKEIVPKHDNILLFGELLTDEAHYWDSYISAFDLESEEIERLLSGYHGTVSPNGERMVYVRDWFDVHLTTYPPSEEDVRLDVDGLNAGQWVDDEHIIYGKVNSQSPELWMLNVDTLEERQLIINPEYREYGGSTVISPDRESWVLVDSHWLGFQRIFRAYLYSWDGEGLNFEKLLFSNENGMYSIGPWSPDGTKLIVFGNRNDDSDGSLDRAVFVYDVKTEEFSQLTFTDYMNEGGPQLGCWSANGNTIYFSTGERIYELDARKVYH